MVVEQRPHPQRTFGRRGGAHVAADHDAVGEPVVVIVIPFAGCAARRGALEDEGHVDIFASARWPASVICTRAMSVCRPPSTMRSRFVVASPALSRSSGMSIENPCARIIALVQPFRLAASNSRARRRSGLG